MLTFDFSNVLRRKKQEAAPAEAATPSDAPVFCIVTPVFNGAAYIDDTIHSILSQAGDFVVHYHVQDGGSTDDTMDRVRRWMTLSEQLPRLCRRLVFTCSSEPDTGMYDAINKGFAYALPPGGDVVMGWIAADDRIAQGAFATMAGIRGEFPDIRFLGGRISLLEETGGIIGVQPIYPYSRRCMAAGLYDGRALPFVMQEGSFWCADLWHKVAGLDTRFRLAGDWDLWRRMAAHEPYFIVDSILGFHRRRPGQLSEHMGRYYEEVDRLLGDAAPATLPEVLVLADPNDAAAGARSTFGAIYQRIAAEYEIIRSDARRFRASAHPATVVRFNLERKLWERRDGFGTAAVAPELVTVAGATTSETILFTTGLHAAEGPYPESGLPLPVRWMNAPLAEGEVQIDAPGQYRIVCRCRNRIPNQSVTILANGQPLGHLQVTAHAYDRDIELSVTGTFDAGSHVIGILVERPAAADRYLLLIDAVIEQLPIGRAGTVLPAPERPIPLATRAADPPRGRWPTISIVVPTHSQGHFLRDTLNSIIRQGYPNLELIVVDSGSGDQTAMILREYSPYLSFLVSEPGSRPGEAVNKGLRAATGEILSWLNSGDLLAEGALHAVAHAFMMSNVDIVAGVCDVFDDRNVTVHRHLPCLVDGALPLADLLDIENKWLRGQFFHQPEVFFRRGIWERAGSGVSEQLLHSIDYDLWVRMAEHGATIRVIGSIIAHVRTRRAAPGTPEARKRELLKHASAIRTRLDLSAMPVAMPVKHRLKIVLFSDCGFEHGAGTACRRVAAALAAAGHDVHLLANARPATSLDTGLDTGPLARPLTASEVADAIVSMRPDLVLVGNIHAGADVYDLIDALLPSGIPTILHAHDRLPATGRRVGQAAIAGRGRFAILTNSKPLQRVLRHALPAAGAPSVHVAPIGIDTDVFGVADRWRARMVLDLPQDRFIVATAAADLADDRGGLAILLRALDLLDGRENVLLLIRGIDEVSPESPIEIRCAGPLHDEDLLALHYQAADLVVGVGLAEAFGQTYVEAGSCGVPSIAFDIDGLSDVIVPGITGLLVEEDSAEALSAAIARVRSDVRLRRQMGVQARLHACNNFSVAASAARLTTILVGEPSLALPLSPTVLFPGEGPVALHLEYLVKPIDAPEPGGMLWIPCSNMIEAMRAAEPGGVRTRFWWPAEPECAFLVRGDEDGPHILTMRLRCHVAGQTVFASINRGAEYLVTLGGSDPDMLQVVQIPVQLFRGLNRVDLRLPPLEQEIAAIERRPPVLFEEVGVRPGTPLRGPAPPDGSFDLITGFDAEEGPYTQWSLPNPFNWALGRQSRVRVYSAVSGRRSWSIRIRNGQQDQRLTIRIDNAVAFSALLDTQTVDVLLTIRFKAYVDAGFHTVAFETTRQSESEADPRRMAFIFEGLELSPVDRDAAIADRADGHRAMALPSDPSRG